MCLSTQTTQHSTRGGFFTPRSARVFTLVRAPRRPTLPPRAVAGPEVALTRKNARLHGRRRGGRLPVRRVPGAARIHGEGGARSRARAQRAAREPDRDGEDAQPAVRCARLAPRARGAAAVRRPGAGRRRRRRGVGTLGAGGGRRRRRSAARRRRGGGAHAADRVRVAHALAAAAGGARAAADRAPAAHLRARLARADVHPRRRPRAARRRAAERRVPGAGRRAGLLLPPEAEGAQAARGHGGPPRRRRGRGRAQAPRHRGLRRDRPAARALPLLLRARAPALGRGALRAVQLPDRPERAAGAQHRSRERRPHLRRGAQHREGAPSLGARLPAQCGAPPRLSDAPPRPPRRAPRRPPSTCALPTSPAASARRRSA
jgi:hypothetical protein